MKALPFIGAVRKVLDSLEGNHNDADWLKAMNGLHKVEQFYSQPFDIGMLVNPIEKPQGLIGMKMQDKKGNWQTTLIKEEKQWQEAEDKVLFEENTETVEIVHSCLLDSLLIGEAPSLDYVIQHLKNEYEVELHWKQSIVDKYFIIK